MGYNVVKSATISPVNVLKYPAPFGVPTKSVVLDANDATAFPAPTDGSRFVARAGTILVNSTASGKVTKYNGSNGPIIGILKSQIDLAAQSTGGYEPAAAYFSLVTFATTGVVDFTLYASALVSSLPRCDFQ